jgi:hypothetical protein
MSIDIPRELTSWKLLRLPKWGHPWDNPRDGCLGDRRLGYWNGGDQYPQWFDKLSWGHYLKAYFWLAIRNPANNLSRYYKGFGCKVDECNIKLLAGVNFVSNVKNCQGYQFVKAEGPVFNYWGFYLYKRIGRSSKFVMIRLGHKIEPRHSDMVFEGEDLSKAWKGFTFRVGIKGN